MKTMIVLSVFSALVCSTPCDAAEPMPPVLYASTLDNSVYEAIKQRPMFAQVDRELYGSPLRLSVTHTFAPTAGGTAAGLTSVMLAGSTLGILPVVNNSNLIITYTLSAHGRKVASFSYTENFTQASNLFSNNLYKLDKRAMAWALTTVDKFIADVEKNAEVSAIRAEYQEYFAQAR